MMVITLSTIIFLYKLLEFQFYYVEFLVEFLPQIADMSFCYIRNKYTNQFSMISSLSLTL